MLTLGKSYETVGDVAQSSTASFVGLGFCAGFGHRVALLGSDTERVK